LLLEDFDLKSLFSCLLSLEFNYLEADFSKILLFCEI